MIVTKERDLEDLAYHDLWCIDDKLDVLTYRDWSVIEDYFEMDYPDGIDLTDLNDIIRFEDDFIAELLGYEDWEELLEDRKKDEEDEGEDENEDEDEDEDEDEEED